MTAYLGPIGMPRLESALRDAREGSPEARWVAAIALGRVFDESRDRAIEALSALLRDPVEEVRAQAIESMGEQARCGARIPEQVALDALRDPSAGARCAAIDTAMALLPDPEEPIAPLLEDPDPSVRAAAASALGMIGAAQKADLLAALLVDTDRFVRTRAAVALALLGDPRALPVLDLELDGKADAAREAAMALGVLGRAEALPGLARCASRRFASPMLRAAVALAMARCGAAGAGERIAEMLASRRSGPRMAVLLALAEQPVSGMTEAVAERLQEGRPDEASCAIETLRALGRIEPGAARAALTRRRGALRTAELNQELEEALESIGSGPDRHQENR